MDPTVLSSLISASVTLLVCLITQWAQNKRTIALIEYKLEVLTQKVEKHNNVIERTFKLEEHNSVQDEQLKVANHRIADLEKKIG